MLQLQFMSAQQMLEAQDVAITVQEHPTMLGAMNVVITVRDYQTNVG
jgi:hypothetical protein